MNKELHPQAKAMIEALWTPRTVEDAWKVASDFLWAASEKAGASLGGGFDETVDAEIVRPEVENG